MFPTLKILIFLRPFISSLAFFWSNLFFSIIFLSFLGFWIIKKNIDFKFIEPLKVPLILFSLSLIVGVVFSLNPIKSISQLHNYIIYILSFIVVASLNQNQKESLRKVFIWISFIISILAIYQYIFGFKNLLDYMANYNIHYSFAQQYISSKRVFFPFITPNALGGFLILNIVFLLEKKNLYFIFIFIVIALFLTKSIGAFLSLFLGLIFYIFLKRKINLKTIILISILISLIISAFLLRSNTLSETLKPYFSLSKRFNYWKQTLSTIKLHPILGEGLGNFNILDTRYSHNFILQIWAELGLIGLSCLLWFLFSYFKYLYLNLKDSSDKNNLIRIFTSTVIFLIHNLVDFTFFLPEICTFWWIIIGLGIKTDE
ncbi:MAG: O-antigen ligase family protein [Candidatus Omnitrophica bacterium]|nr:O-antigen ligase family protein [Candidatus Omnitrophota bacterium]